MREMADLQKLCVHSITTKPWSLEECLRNYADAGVGGISIWQNVVEDIGLEKAKKLVREYPIDVVSYVRGGFFPSINKETRAASLSHNKQMIDEAAALGAPLLVLVCGAEPEQSLDTSRQQISQGIGELLPHARNRNVKLSIEPLHPMYADTRSAVNTLEQANDMAESLVDDYVGVAVDVYHLWWDPNLEREIKRCGTNKNIHAFHICDWKYPTEDMLNDRGLMGEGCIPVKQISSWVFEAGFDGYIEVEIFSNKYWKMDQKEFLHRIINAYNLLY